MTTHIMLDIETWGKIPGSDIRSIGAVVFNPLTGSVCPEDEAAGQFYVNTARCYKLKRDDDTVMWWSQQSPEAQAAFASPAPVDLRKALTQFRDWLSSVVGPYMVDGDDPLRLWANDPHFDVSILAAAFRAVGLDEPWHYRSPRSQKTITEAAGMTREDYAPFNHGTAHNALDDAISQAGIVCEAYRRLRLADYYPRAFVNFNGHAPGNWGDELRAFGFSWSHYESQTMADQVCLFNLSGDRKKLPSWVRVS